MPGKACPFDCYEQGSIVILQIKPLEKPRDFDPFGQTGLPPSATI